MNIKQWTGSFLGVWRVNESLLLYEEDGLWKMFPFGQIITEEVVSHAFAHSGEGGRMAM